MNIIDRVVASAKRSVGDRVAFTLNKDTPYEVEMTGEITQIISYGLGAYFVIEYHAVIDFALTMEHSLLVRDV